MPSAESLAARYESVLQSFVEHEEYIAHTREVALNDLLPSLATELDLDAGEIDRSKVFLDDAVTIWRFLRRARFEEARALDLLRNSLKWRISSSLDMLSAAALDPLYIDEPVFYFHPRLVDRFGRPCAILNLKHVRRTADGSLDALKEYIVLGWEVGRRYLSELTRKRREDQPPVVQLVLIVDLAGAGMSNLELELLPLMLDLLKSHFPSMVGCLFVLNFGWAYAGMWQLAKRVLPKPALDRIIFPTKDDLLHFFDESALLKEHGGTVRYRYSFKGSVFARVGRPIFASPSPSANASPFGSRTPSRASSFESLADVYHSTPASPHASRPSTPGMSSHRSSGSLSMTSLASAVAANAEKPEGRPLRRARSSTAELRQHLPGRDPHQSSDESEISADEAVQARVARHRSGEWSAGSSRAASRAQSREVSPNRVRSSPVIRREDQKISRFSAANPFFGYPVQPVGPNGTPEPIRRRRKRDLVRTLFYLVVLRLLALRRSIGAELHAIYLAVLNRLRLLGLVPPAKPPPRVHDHDPAVRLRRPGKRRKAVTFVDIDVDEEEAEERRRERRAARARRLAAADQPSSASAGASRAGASPGEGVARNTSGVQVAAVLLCCVLVLRSGRLVCWVKAGPPDSRRARLRQRLKSLWP